MTEPALIIGKFKAFPEIAVQALAELTYIFHPKKLSILVIEALYELNSKTEIADSELVTTISPVTCKYEIGIAEDVYFNYLTKEEVKKLKEYVKKNTPDYLDFIFYIFFKYKKENGKEVSLWSDSNYIRFNMTQTGRLKILVHQFKGTRKLPLDALIKKIIEKINEKTEAQGLKKIKLETLRGH